MKKKYFVLIFVACWSFALGLTVQAKNDRNGFTIISKGKTAFVIVLPVKPTDVEQTAVKELQEYLQKSTGVLIPVVSENTSVKKGIYVGATSYAKSAGATDSREEAWIIKAFHDNLILTGGATRGTLYAVYHFLEDRIGVRWWSPWEEDVPKLGKISVSSDLHLSGNPSFPYRDIYDYLFDDLRVSPTGKTFLPYQVRNRLNGHYTFAPPAYGGRISYGKPYHVHTFSRYFPVDKYFATHPEWYAYSKEKKERINTGQLCLANKELLEVFKQEVRDSIKASYEKADRLGEKRPAFFSVSLNDTKGLCECDECTKLIQEKGESGYILSFVNQIADYIAPIYPDAKIETLSYWQYRIPPKDDTKPAKNMIIRLAEDRKDLMRSVDHPHNEEVLDRLKKWEKLCDNNNLYIWDYCLNYSNATTSSVFRFERDMHIFKEHNVQGLFMEVEWPLISDMWNLRFWVLEKLLENINLDTNVLIDDFVHHYYGAAAQPVKDFIYMIKASTDTSSAFVSFRTDVFKENYINLDMAVKGNKLMEQALSKVKNDEVLSRRVRHFRTYFDKVIVNRNDKFKEEARAKGIDFLSLPLDRKLAAQRIVSTLKEMTNYAINDVRTIREIGIYDKISNEDPATGK